MEEHIKSSFMFQTLKKKKKSKTESLGKLGGKEPPITLVLSAQTLAKTHYAC
jgi:hypothetical protein